MIVESDVEFVKQQAEFHRRQGERFVHDKDRSSRHIKFAHEFDDLAERILASIKSKDTAPINAPTVPHIKPTFGQLRIGNVDDLPMQLREQIKISESEQLDHDIMNIIKEFGGIAAIDEIMVQLWRNTTKIHDRDFLSRKLYRMIQSGSLFSAKRKGHYMLAENGDVGVESENTEDIFG